MLLAIRALEQKGKQVKNALNVTNSSGGMAEYHLCTNSTRGANDGIFLGEGLVPWILVKDQVLDSNCIYPMTNHRCIAATTYV